MPLFDYACPSGHVFEALASADKEQMRCRHCRLTARRIFISAGSYRRPAQPFKPVVVFRKRDGSYSVPGSPDKRTPEGSERIELKTVSEVRRFEREMDTREARRHDEREVREQQQFEHVQSMGRSLLRQEMRRMSAQGRDFARFAIEQNNRAAGRRYDPGCHIDVFTYNPSNLDSRHRE